MQIRFTASFYDGETLYPRSSRFGEEWDYDKLDKLPSSALIKVGTTWVKHSAVKASKELQEELSIQEAKPAVPDGSKDEQTSGKTTGKADLKL